MQWSPQQDRGLKKIHAWLKDRNAPQVFRCFGYAGTGKTTIAIEAAQGCSGQVLYAAPTARAAYVMASKGCEGAGTVHSLIYTTRTKSDFHLNELLKKAAETSDETEQLALAKEIEHEKRNLKDLAFSLNADNSALQYADLLILDEASMIDERTGLDILSFGVKVLILGDPFQLPPVRGLGYFTHINADEPEVMLTEIHRQALESPVVTLATAVRNHQRIEIGKYGESEVMRKGSKPPEFILAHDQVLCGTHVTRRSAIRKIREIRGFAGPLPQVGETVIGLRNNRKIGLANGSLWKVLEVNDPVDDMFIMRIAPDVGGQDIEVISHVHHFEGRGEELTRPFSLAAEEFDFGWCITTHKAQGSQWSKIALIDESSVFRGVSDRWLYTGITRAEESISVLV